MAALSWDHGFGLRAAGWRGGLLAPLVGLAGARGHLLPLWAVGLGVGIGIWFGWPADPKPAVLAGALMLAAALLALRRFGPMLLFAPAILLLALPVGFLAADLRARMVASPMLEFRYYGPVQGRVTEIDRSASDALRITLDRVVLERLAPARTPAKVRISLRSTRVWHDPAPGQVVILTAHLAAPEGPVEPGGFDFRRMAFFDRLGAVGYTATPVLLHQPAAPGAAWIGQLRTHLSAAIRAAIPGQAGAFAAGAMTGDRSAISPETVAALRDSSLAHILAISGMNMAFLAAFVFALIRGGMALVPPVALRVNAKKVSAVLSFGVAGFYLALSGSNVATERAFLMISVMLGAILLDRQAMSLRAAGLAAILILLWQPESLLALGFQMSMAATVALIAGFRGLDALMLRRRWPRLLVPVLTLLASSLIGGFATAPYAAAHFNRFADYGLLANVLTVPAMGLLIMPMGVLAMLLAPFGLAGLPLWLMGLGAGWTLHVAHRIAALDGAVTAIPAPPGGVLALVTLGGCWLLLWPGRLRWAGLVVLALGLALWPLGRRPDLLITADARLIGLLGPEGRALSSAKGGGFAAANWLENDGDLAPQATAATRPGFDGPPEMRRFVFGGAQMVALSGKRGLARLAEACTGTDLVIIALPLPPDARPEGCPVLDQRLLRQTGALAFRLVPGGAELHMARDPGRIWSGAGPDADLLRPLLPPGFVLAGQGGTAPNPSAQAP